MIQSPKPLKKQVPLGRRIGGYRVAPVESVGKTIRL